MALKLETKISKPPRILIYGESGLGKSTFGSLAPNPVFIQIEDGLDAMDVQTFEKVENYDMLISQLEQVATEEHDFKTLVIDSIDWLESIIWNQVCLESNVKNINSALGGYGKGYSAAVDFFREYLDALDFLRNKKNMMIIQIAHANVKKYENPDTDAYDRYQVKLQDKASDLFFEYSDIVLFLNTFITTKKEDAGFSKDRKRAVGSNERILYTSDRPTARAKSRYDLPAEIIFDEQGEYWKTIMDAVPYFQQQKNKKTKGE